MTRVNDPRITTLHAMSGNMIKVLVTMGIIGGVNVGNKEIHAWNGLSLPTIASCLDSLMAMGLVTQTHRTNGWQITAQGFNHLMGPEPSEKFLHSDSSSSSRLLNNKELKELNTTTTSTASEKILHKPKKYGPEFDPIKDVRDEINQEAHAYMLGHGIYDPTATELAHLVWVDYEYIKPWAIWVKAQKLDVGLAVYRIRHKWEAPALNPNDHPGDCDCRKCRYGTYYEEDGVTVIKDPTV